ncbi:hypothetical protein TREVI0001_1646 [Treponema vincentii ATCC 35580]|uniref:Uncharacterized protein n=1 Tax=Treponema vincentii ATCC 35580 TaxID=596324 RepID=C8PQR9_9SPIR|nr:hypothetical protein TREVI0001_1646 [Treponema vincentii ATCC 35580]
MLLLLQYIPAGGLESWVRFRHPSPHGAWIRSTAYEKV